MLAPLVLVAASLLPIATPRSDLEWAPCPDDPSTDCVWEDLDEADADDSASHSTGAVIGAFLGAVPAAGLGAVALGFLGIYAGALGGLVTGAALYPSYTWGAQAILLVPFAFAGALVGLVGGAALGGAGLGFAGGLFGGLAGAAVGKLVEGDE